MASWRTLPTMDYYLKKSRFNAFCIPADDDTTVPIGQRLNVVIIGRTGSGKSATGNSIVGSRKFASRLTPKAVTQTTQWATRTDDREIMVIDTPGIYDNRMNFTYGEILSEIGKCVEIAKMESTKGLHAILLTINANCRLTDEQSSSIEILHKTFGDDFTKYLIIVFTRGDALEEEGLSLDSLLSNKPRFLETLLNACNQRCMIFNNWTTNVRKQKQQVADLVRLIDRMYIDNGCKTFTANIMENISTAVTDEQQQNRNLLFIGLTKHVTDTVNMTDIISSTK
ncbi:uncharacterized protein LOC144434024 [Glandiceps talaboti]